MLECVVNISEGRHAEVVDEIAAAGRGLLLDVHHDPHHNRAVVTLAGGPANLEAAVEAVAESAFERLDLRDHTGVHPRIGVVDVVPFVPLTGSTMEQAAALRARFADWAWSRFAVPAFFYGSERSLPDVRRGAFTDLHPDVGGPGPHRWRGAVAVGARPVLVAFNVWLAEADVAAARRVARALRGPAIRALGLSVGKRAQVSMNLLDPLRTGPAAAYDAVARLARTDGAELVGLVPRRVLEAIPPTRWDELDLSQDRTIESRLARAAGATG